MCLLIWSCTRPATTTADASCLFLLANIMTFSMYVRPRGKLCIRFYQLNHWAPYTEGLYHYIFITLVGLRLSKTCIKVITGNCYNYLFAYWYLQADITSSFIKLQDELQHRTLMYLRYRGECPYLHNANQFYNQILSGGNL